MKSYGGVYYDQMKELRHRSCLRVFKGLKEPLGKDVNWQYVTSEHFKYLFYKQQMALWRRNVKNVIQLKTTLKGKMT